jgi:hypothetical protein
VTALPSTLHRPVLVLLAISCLIVGMGGARADAATVTASYERGYADAIINGYGTRAMGTFQLRDGDQVLLALCVEADVPHSRLDDAYHPVESVLDDGALDALLWWLDRQPEIDDDTAIAAAALAWFYADARRSNGPLVWADGSRNFAPITPLSPEAWDSLATFSLSHPVGLSVPGTHLDDAERRVAELHQLATHLTGPWSLTLDAPPGTGRATVRVVSANGPIVGQPVDVSIEAAGAPVEPTAPVTVTTVTVTTGRDGRAEFELPDLPDGGTVRATATAPGPHREWDGDGAVQRLATPTDVDVAAELDIAPLPRYVEVRKRSTDTTIGVADAVFVLTDSHGDEIATATSDADGIASFGPIEPTGHPTPWQLGERSAPPGLVPGDGPITLTDIGHAADDPTVVEVTNHAATIPLVVHKVLSMDGVGPGDLTGFRFVARRRVDGAAHVLVTGPSGHTAPVDLPLGTYDVCEVGTPDWATTLVDTGCRTVVIDVGVLGGSGIAVDYLNEVAVPVIDTLATDVADGDHELVADVAGSFVDRVDLERLVPGTTYTLVSRLVAISDPSAPVGVSTTTPFVAEGTSASIDVHVDVEAAAAGSYLVVQRLYVGEALVAEHADLDDADQALRFVAPVVPASVATTSTAAPVTTAPTTPPTTTTSTTTSSTTTSSTSVAPETSTPPTLPPTGNGDATATAVRLGDAGFVLGVALIALPGLVPRRPGRDEAGC